jgi:sugar lactone lactonase YvrE
VDLDSEGNIYVVTYNGEVVRFAPDGAPLGSWSVEGRDLHPDSIEVDNAGSVYLALGDQIRKYDGATGFEQRVINVAEIFGASDLAMAPDGSLLTFLGGPLDQIVRYDPTGMEVARYQRPITEYDPSVTTAPWLIRIASDSQGRIYLLNTSMTGTPVFVYSPEGEHLAHFGVRGDAEGEISSPDAIAVDSKERIYVSGSNGVQVFDQEGGYVGVIRMPFSYRPGAMAFDKQDRLYVVARGATKVYRFVLNEP